MPRLPVLDIYSMFDGEIPEDDRRTCNQCRNLSRRGRCLAAERRELPQTAKYHFPLPRKPRRCTSYMPQQEEPDQRGGYERWPWLWGDS